MNFHNSLEEQRRIVAYLDGLEAKVNALRELQSALMLNILDEASKINVKGDSQHDAGDNKWLNTIQTHLIFATFRRQ
jgi:restriction endonuclease S subunit